MNYTELLNSALQIIIPALATLLASWFAILGAKLKTVYEQKVKDENAKIVIDNVVRFVQQVYKDVDGTEKLKIAISKASSLLEEKGIDIGESELNMLIESAVFGIKQTSAEIQELAEENNVG